MADCQHDARGTTGVEHTCGVLAAKRKRLFAKYLLSSRCRRNHLREVLRMRRCQEHSLYRGIGKYRFKALGEQEVVRLTEV
jgi:hypothetical protein